MLGFDSLDEVLEALGDKLQRTSRGSYIKVDDLRELMEQRAEEKRGDRTKQTDVLRPRTFEQARVLAQSDPDFMERFKKAPIAIEGNR